MLLDSVHEVNTDSKSDCEPGNDTDDLREEGWRCYASVRAPPAGQDGDL